MPERKTPQVRFKGFTDTWEQRKLGDFCEMFNGDRGINYPKDSDMVQAGIPFVNAGDLQEGKVNLATANKITREKFDQLGGAKIKRGDILYCLRGTLGKNAFVDNFDEGTVASSLVDIRPKNVDAQYLFTVLNSDIEYRQRILCDEGAAQPNLSARNLANFDIPVPKIAEQVKIGRYFESLSNIITLHQREGERLQMIKKSMLENCFPKNGEKVPRFRFVGFTGDWEQRKLGDLMDVGSVKRVHQSDWRDSGVRFLRARDVVADFNNEEPDDYLYIDQKMYEEYSAQSGKVQQGDLLVTGVGTIGIPMLIKSEKPLYFKDGNIIWFKNKNAIDGQFFYYSSISKGIQDFIKESAGTGTVGTYTIDSGKKTPINLPTSIEEQKEIGIYFKNIDNLITLHQSKLKMLKKIKESMLGKMLV